MIENLLWQKYRPDTMEDMILLPRIRKIIESNLNSSLIFHGSFGTGKTTLAKILVKDKPCISFNTSLKTGIDILREDIQRHIDTISDIFHPTDTYKYVFLDEFERASPDYQDALKGFIEDYSDRARFIFVTNHIHKVEQGVISRCTSLDFNPKTEEEVRFWKTSCKEKLLEISEKEKIKISEKDVKHLVNHNYPDLRQMIVILDNIRLTGRIDYTITAFDDELKMSLYKLLMNGDILKHQEFIMENFGPEKIQELFNLCGRPLLEVLIVKNKEIIKTEKLGDIYSIVAEHSMWLNTIKGGDPIVVGSSCLNKIKNILHG